MVEKIQLPISQLFPSLNSTNRSGSSGSDTTDPFKALNLDSLSLSKDAQNKITWAKAQFEANYQVLRSMNTANGIETTQQSFSFQASFDFLQRASGQDPLSNSLSNLEQQLAKTAKTQVQTSETTTSVSTSSTTEEDALSKLREYFSPEKTASRILDVALSFFPHSQASQQEGEPTTQRKAFADFIGGAIDEGFRQAKSLLGNLPDTVSGGIDTTHSLIFTGLADFVKNGVNPEKLQPGGVFEKIAAYRQESIAYSEQLRATVTQGNYTAKGDLASTAAPTPSIFTKG